MLTEEEAKLKFCPMTFSGSSEGSSCVASNCMAWRWGESLFEPIGGQKVLREGARSKIVPNDDRLETPRGYCGLAGRPE